MQGINVQDLGILAKERLNDAKALYDAKRYSGAVYICGYAVELGLKKKICETLGWDEYAMDSKYKSLKTHELEVLLHFSGVEKFVTVNLKAEWSGVLKWQPDQRYSTNALFEIDAKLMIESAEALLKAL